MDEKLSTQPATSDSASEDESSSSSPFDVKQGHKNFSARLNAGEAAGETIAVMGESTGRFPRVEVSGNGKGESTGRSAFMVGAGILISRIIGGIRQRVCVHYLCPSHAAGTCYSGSKLHYDVQRKLR